jgi:hypothetical protein
LLVALALCAARVRRVSFVMKGGRIVRNDGTP